MSASVPAGSFVRSPAAVAHTDCFPAGGVGGDAGSCGRVRESICTPEVCGRYVHSDGSPSVAIRDAAAAPLICPTHASPVCRCWVASVSVSTIVHGGGSVPVQNLTRIRTPLAEFCNSKRNVMGTLSDHTRLPEYSSTCVDAPSDRNSRIVDVCGSSCT